MFDVLRERERTKRFDVVCAGEALFKIDARDASLRLRAGGGAVSVALALGRAGLRVGLASTLGDDSYGRALKAKVAAAGVDVEAVGFAAPQGGLVVLEGAGGEGRQMVSYRDEELPVRVPEHWATQVLLVSGLSPIVANAASLCKAARAARRAGSIVVVDVAARWHLWAGRDARTIQSVLREADVVHHGTEDLVALGIDVAALVRTMRADATLVTRDPMRGVRAVGPFGEVGWIRGDGGRSIPTSICAELAKASTTMKIEVWDRALRRTRPHDLDGAAA